MATQSDNPLAYSSAFRESKFMLKQVMKARITKQGSRADEELLAFQTDQAIETAHVDPIQMGKVMELQATTADLGPIKAGTHIQNKRMKPSKWSAVKNILHRIISIARVLRIPSDRRRAREMLQQVHEDTIQDQQRGPPFLIRFNQFFNISGIADTEYQHYLQQALNCTEHPKMKTSAADDFADEAEIKATALGREISREEVEELFLARDNFLTNKASRKEIDEGHLSKDTRSKIYRPTSAPAQRRTCIAAHVGTAPIEQTELDHIKAEVKTSGVKAAERAAKQAVAAALGMKYTDEPPEEDTRAAAMAAAGNSTCAVGFETSMHWKEMQAQVTKLKKDNTEMREWCKQKDKGDESRDAKISAVAGVGSACLYVPDSVLSVMIVL